MISNPGSFAIFLTGCLGAAAPEIVRLYRLRARKATFNSLYLLISVAFFALGGLVAAILPATTLWGAFYVGAGLPAIVSSVNGKGIAPKPSFRSPQAGAAGLSVREYLSFW